ncbi:SDR family oxidoreductase [Atopomonas hussainii]|uniref:SDR family oxidoreductase n=1 Tax=Atopomonas hussainii TaxID=1429083 RepID=UPI0008FFF66F|nr:SDR family oxidoreductase [Atopomonas hussainii]
MPRSILITGCSSGIGHALARAFAAHGDLVIATARRLSSLESLSPQCQTMALDVTSDTSRAALLEQLAEKGIRHIDILINNAGISAMGPVIELPAEQLRGQFETNVIAPVLLTQALFPLLQQSQRPLVVNIGSVSGVLTTPFAGAYCASKAALHSLSDALRMELAPFGVQVITVQPGAIQSSFGDSAASGVEAWLGSHSLYAHIRDGIMARAQASQVNATAADDFAATLLTELNTDQPKALIRIGKGSRSMRAVARLLPSELTRTLLSRKFSLNRLPGIN